MSDTRIKLELIKITSQLVSARQNISLTLYSQNRALPSKTLGALTKHEAHQSRLHTHNDSSLPHVIDEYYLVDRTPHSNARGA